MYLSTLNSIFTSTSSTSNLFVAPQPLQMYSFNVNWLQNFQLFDISTLVAHDIRVEALKFNQLCEGPNMTRIGYGECANSQLYEDAALDYDAFIKKRAGTVIPANSALIWKGVSYEHSISSTLPSWSMHKRQDREIFGKWIFNTGNRCKDGNAANSICHMGQSIKEAVTQWKGGDFNPFEMCDTFADGDISSSTTIVQEMISCSCNPQICKDQNADYYIHQPSKLCVGKSGVSTRPKWANVPKRVTQYESTTDVHTPYHFQPTILSSTMPAIYENNLCVHQPVVPRTCKHPQGMLGGRVGRTMQSPVASKTDLYRDTAPRYTDNTLLYDGMGLFYNGGNPIYSADKTSVADMEQHGIMKQNKNDLAGHHIVLKVKRDEHGTPYMIVDRIPLSYHRTPVNI